MVIRKADIKFDEVQYSRPFVKRNTESSQGEKWNIPKIKLGALAKSVLDEQISMEGTTKKKARLYLRPRRSAREPDTSSQKTPEYKMNTLEVSKPVAMIPHSMQDVEARPETPTDKKESGIKVRIKLHKKV